MKKLFLFFVFLGQIISIYSQNFPETCDENRVTCGFDAYNTGNTRMTNVFFPNNGWDVCNTQQAYGAFWMGYHLFQDAQVQFTAELHSWDQISNNVPRGTYTGYAKIAVYKDCKCSPPITYTEKTWVNLDPGALIYYQALAINNLNLTCGKYFFEVSVGGQFLSYKLSKINVNSSVPGYRLPSKITVNNDTDNNITVCASTCPYALTVDPLPNGGCAEYLWSIDGVEVSREKTFQFDREIIGVKKIIVTLTTGDALNGSACDEKMYPITINVVKQADKKGKDIYLCQEELTSGTYIWHNQIISEAGEYIARFQEPSNCCSFDSVVNFQELPIYALNPHYFVAKNNSELYYDQKIKTVFDGCNYNKFVNSKFTSQGRTCDSAYLLTTLYPKLTSNLVQEVQGNNILLKTNINNVTDICKTAAKFDFKYSWSKRNAPGLVLGTEQNLLISTKEDYHLNVHADITIDGKVFPFDSLFKFYLLTGVNDSQLNGNFEPIINCNNGRLKIDFSNSISQFNPTTLEIINLQGIVIDKQKIDQAQISFETKSCPTGIYFIRFKNINGKTFFIEAKVFIVLIFYAKIVFIE